MNLNAPTVHGMFSFSPMECKSKKFSLDSKCKKVQDFKAYYQKVEVFIIDEYNALSADMTGLIDELMTLAFNPDRKKSVDDVGRMVVPPFGGKRVVFVGDPAQLPPVAGDIIYLGPSAAVLAKGGKFKDRRVLHSQRGLAIYKDHLRRHCIIFERTQRNQGCLGEIADALRKGEQTQHHYEMLTYRRRLFPHVVCDKGIHYENESTSASNIADLWKCCKDDGRRLFFIRASYNENFEDPLIIDGLSAMPAKAYGYAPHVLFLAVGCEVRLVTNIDVAAGLVNGVNGHVVRVVFDEADKFELLQGNNPPPYALIVEVPEYRGKVNPVDISAPRVFPFPDHPTWVVVYREKFQLDDWNSVPRHLVKKIEVKMSRAFISFNLTNNCVYIIKKRSLGLLPNFILVLHFRKKTKPGAFSSLLT